MLQIKKIRVSVDEANNKELTYTFQRIEKQLSEQGHIQKIVLDDILCSEITATTPMQPRDRRFLAASFTRQDTGPGRPHFRPGLRDLQ
uniref:Uncharacterized protein n=1 Tax=Timema douglasi TaxID=61478 RepID=A0A7R8ZH51_TIMDO|nr:unnamed protein product [Timema douglasi]